MKRGLSNLDGNLHFEPPADSSHISFTPTGQPTTNSQELEVNRLVTLMGQLGHAEIDVVKINIVGAEYAAVKDIVASGVRPQQLLIKFNHNRLGFTNSDTHQAVMSLYEAGYQRFFVGKAGHTQGFVYSPSLDTLKHRAPPQFMTLRQQTPDAKHDRGVVYFAFGKPALDEAKLSRKSLRASNPDVPAAIFTDLPEDANDFDIIHKFSNSEQFDIEHFFREPKRMPSMKVRFLRQTPFRRTIHLDCDTYVKGSLDEFFQALEQHHFILTNMPELEQVAQEGAARPVHQSLKNLTRSSSFSCAVFGYRRARETDELLQTWWTQFVEKTAGPVRYKGNWGNTGGVNEQGILHDMLADGSFTRAGINKGILPNIKYNAGMSMWPRLKAEGLWEECCVLHSHAIMQNIGNVGVNGLPDLPQLQKFK